MIGWNEHFIMGIPALDEEHRQIFRLAGRILEIVHTPGGEEAARMSALRQGMNDLITCFSRHAAREEAYMREIRCEGYALHKRLHDDFRSAQMIRYRQIVARDTCSEEAVRAFIGAEIGWLVEHMATADLAIIGKRGLSRPAARGLDLAVVEREINRLFRTALNMEVNAVAADTCYGGESPEEMICQKIVYRWGWRKSAVVCGVEPSFVRHMARLLYGNTLEKERDLILSTVEMFSARLWITLNRHLTGLEDEIDVCENQFLPQDALPGELRGLEPAVSVLFTSDQGRFFVATDARCIGKRMKSA